MVYDQSRHHIKCDQPRQHIKKQRHYFARDSLVAQIIKCLPQCGRPMFDPWVRKIPWRRKWQPTPVFLPGKFHGWRSLVGYSPWGRKELDTTERLHFLSFFTLLTKVHLVKAMVFPVVMYGCESWTVKKAEH